MTIFIGLKSYERNQKVLLGGMLILACLLSVNLSAKDYILKSPDEKIVVNIRLEDKVNVSIEDASGVLVEELVPAMSMEGRSPGINPRVKTGIWEL